MNTRTNEPGKISEAPGALSDAATENDELGRERYVKALKELTISSDTPMVLAIYGTWGVGKTSLMMQLRRRLDPGFDKENPGKEDEAYARTVWFDPWMHQFDKTPVLGLLHATTEQLGLTYKVGVKEALIEIASAFTENIEIPYVGIKIGRLFKVRKEIEESQFRKREQQTRLHQHFEKVILAARETGKRIAFFIDDLDRCHPGQALAMLEALKLYMNFSDCIYVLGVDRGPLESAVKQQYCDLELNAESYLDKIVQLPFVIPTIKEDVLIKFIDKRIPEKLNSCRKILATAGADDPRQVKRILNSLSFNDHLVEPYTFQPQEYDPTILTMVVLLQHLAPELYRLIRLQPDLIHDLYGDIIQRKVDPGKETRAPNEDNTPIETVDTASSASPYRELWEKHLNAKPRLFEALLLINVPQDLDLTPYLTLASTIPVESQPDNSEKLQKEKLRINQMQKESISYLRSGSFKTALSISKRALSLLERELRQFSWDPYLLVSRGFIMKNMGVAQQGLGQNEESDISLSKAHEVFDQLTKELPQDPAPWNGLGSVALARGEYEKALSYIEEALNIDPKYEAALQDREMLLRYMDEESSKSKK